MDMASPDSKTDSVCPTLDYLEERCHVSRKTAIKWRDAWFEHQDTPSKTADSPPAEPTGDDAGGETGHDFDEVFDADPGDDQDDDVEDAAEDTDQDPEPERPRKRRRVKARGLKLRITR